VPKPLKEWVDTEVRAAKRQPLRWLSERYFFRDPVRAVCADSGVFLSPADGVVLYARELEPNEPLLEIKGRNYTLRQALRDDDYAQRSLVIGIFMTAYDVHINRIPYSGTLTYRELPPLHTCNRPMLDVEQSLLRGHGFHPDHADYLFPNQRMLSRVRARGLGLDYHLLQIGDYDVSTIVTFDLAQNRLVFQGQRFSQIRFGSQVDLIIPLTETYRFEPRVETGQHVEAGLDALVQIHGFTKGSATATPSIATKFIRD
jgi:phosphatidylserine decarboxylase